MGLSRCQQLRSIRVSVLLTHCCFWKSLTSSLVLTPIAREDLASPVTVHQVETRKSKWGKRKGHRPGCVIRLVPLPAHRLRSSRHLQQAQPRLQQMWLEIHSRQTIGSLLQRLDGGFREQQAQSPSSSCSHKESPRELCVSKRPRRPEILSPSGLPCGPNPPWKIAKVSVSAAGAVVREVLHLTDSRLGNLPSS